MAKADSTYACNAYACRGYQYADNASRLKTYSPGDAVTFHVDLVAGHRPGHAVSSIRKFPQTHVADRPACRMSR